MNITTATIAKHHQSMNDNGIIVPIEIFGRVESGLQQIASQLKAIGDFEVELEKKIQNNLALVNS